MIKKIISIGIFFVFILYSCSEVFAASIPDAPDNIYFADFAHVFSFDSQMYVEHESFNLCAATKGAQVIVVTVPSLEDMDIKDYALELGRKWGVGDKTKNNGVVILLAPNEKKINVSVGTGLEGRMPDSKVGRFIDEYALDSLKSGNWDKGIIDLYSAIVEEVYLEYNKKPSKGVKIEKRREIPSWMILSFLLCILVMWIFLFKKLGFKRASSLLFFTFLSGGFHSSGRHGSGRKDDKGGGGGDFSGGGASRGF